MPSMILVRTKNDKMPLGTEQRDVEFNRAHQFHRCRQGVDLFGWVRALHRRPIPISRHEVRSQRRELAERAECARHDYVEMCCTQVLHPTMHDLDVGKCELATCLLQKGSFFLHSIDE